MKKILMSSFFILCSAIIAFTQNDYALEFDGANDYVEFDQNLILPDTVTIEMWVNPYSTYFYDASNGHGQFFLAKNGPSGGSNIVMIGHYVHYRNGNYFNDRDGLFVRVQGGPDNFGSGGEKIAGWHHLAVVIQAVDDVGADSSDITVYRNGNFLWSARTPSIINDSTTNMGLILGMEWDDGPVASDFFNGQINEVRLWDHVRSLSEIQSNMNHQLAGNEGGLIAYWPIDQGAGQIIIDRKVGGTYHGQLGSDAAADDNDPAWCLTEFPTNINPTLIASSDFSSNSDGWTLTADIANGPYHSSTGGNPDGCIWGEDQGGSYWFFEAPEKFLGVMSGVYGYSIMFDIKQDSIRPDQQTNLSNDIVLVSDTVSLSFDFGYNPADTFSTYCVPVFEGFEEGRGWINDSTNITATKEELQTVLSNLTNLKIRGEFQAKSDEAWLDNVKIYGNKAPEDFSITSPDNEATLSYSGAIPFQWNAAIDEEGDDITYTLNIFNGSIDTTIENITTTNCDFNIQGFLPQDVPIYWTLSASDGISTTVCSDTFSFSVTNYSPSDFGLIHPANEAILTSLETIQFSWHPSTDADNDFMTYDLYIYNNGINITFENISDTSYTFENQGFIPEDESINWTVLASDGITSTSSSDTFSFSITVTGIDELSQTLKKFTLYQNYPNPFNLSTIIKYNLQKPNHTTIKVYNLVGQELETLVNEFQSMGEHEITWEPKGLPNGIYFYRLQAGDFSETKKLILHK